MDDEKVYIEITKKEATILWIELSELWENRGDKEPEIESAWISLLEQLNKHCK